MLNKIAKVFSFQMKQAWTSPRILLLLILTAIFIFTSLQPVSIFSQTVGVQVTPWAFPHITSDYICQLVIMAVAVLLFCDAPFKTQAHLYVLPRAGHIAWTAGVCLYIVALALLYVLLIFLASVLALFPNIEFSSDWGKIWGTLARTAASSQFEIPITVYDYIIGKYLPLQATLTSFALTWACCIWIGLLVFFFNNATDTMLGTLVAAAFVLLDITVANEWTQAFYRISPVTLAQLQALSRAESLYGLTLSYAVRFFAVTITAFVILCMITPYMKKRLQIAFPRRVKYNG